MGRHNIDNYMMRSVFAEPGAFGDDKTIPDPQPGTEIVCRASSREEATLIASSMMLMGPIEKISIRPVKGHTGCYRIKAVYMLDTGLR